MTLSTDYSKSIGSKYNLLNILPIDPVKKIYTYYLGVFLKNTEIGVKASQRELIEVERAPSGSRIEDYFPLIVDSFNRRGNWKSLSTKDANNSIKIDFSFSNSSFISSKSRINYRFLLDSKDHYISDKTHFYDKFSGTSFIPKYISVNQNISTPEVQKQLEIFRGKSVILKPDKGSVSSGIKVLAEYSYEQAKDYILKSEYKDWTISEVIKSKLYDNYIISNRIYFLVCKEKKGDNFEISSYFYSEFMNYRADKKFTGDIENNEEFLTNYMDPNNKNADEEFVKTRFIPHQDWLNNFSKVERDSIYDQLKLILYTITNTMKDDLMSFNDNLEDRTVGFHIYGLDALVDNSGKVTIIEVNGAPAFNVKTRYYKVPNRIDYFDVMEEIIQTIVDPVYEPITPQKKLSKFIMVYYGIKKRGIKNLYYIPQSIITTYPFIYNTLKTRKFLARTKNPHDNIDVFYGLRERYAVPETNLNYYDELINYKMSSRLRNAKIINKIQGITYYLASKDGLYNKMISKYGDDAHEIHPESLLLNVSEESNSSIQLRLSKFLKKYKSVNDWIVKPVHGSRGLGIKIFHSGDFISKIIGLLTDKLSGEIINYIMNVSNSTFNISDVKKNTFNGKTIIKTSSKVYKYWIVGRYINEPHIFTDSKKYIKSLSKLSQKTYESFITNKPTILDKKYNIRIYCLVVLNDIPTLKDIDTFGDNESDKYKPIKVYMYTDFMLYFSMLEYYSTEIPKIYSTLHPDMISDMRNLTNLEIVNNVCNSIYDATSDIEHKKINMKKDVTSMLSDIFTKNSPEFLEIKSQAINIVEKTIKSVKYDLRPLNRHDNYKGCFNLIAYDTLLDNSGKLWLIEVNRGPDMVGLRYNIGEDGCYKMFDEIFKLAVDYHYTNDINSACIDLFESIPIKYSVA